MIKWLAFFFAFIALMSGPSSNDVRLIDARLKAIEGRQCILMAVNTPNGVSSICAEAK